MDEKAKELKGGNLDIDLTSQGKVPWEQASCPWNEAEGTNEHKCAKKSVSICKYFCGIKHLDTVLCSYPNEPGAMIRDANTGALTHEEKAGVFQEKTLPTKIEISEKPDSFIEYWPGQLDGGNFFGYVCGLPSVLDAITTLKENGKTNVNFHFGGTFIGGKDGYFAIVPLGKGCHTYANIMRTGEFVINYLGKRYFDACAATIGNDEDTDEFTAGGFTREQAKTVSAPRIAEAFFSVECKFEKELDFGDGVIVGRVTNVALAEEFSGDIDGKYGDDGYMLFMWAKNLQTGKQVDAMGVCKVEKIVWEG